MKLAYLILAHNNVEQLKRLVNQLYDKNHTFIIHFDKKASNEEFISLKNYFNDIGNVYFSKRIKCYWGDFSLVKASLNSIQSLFDLKIKFDYAFLLSGQDYPLVKNDFIEDFLKKQDGKQFIQYFNPVEVWKTNDRIKYFHFNKYSRIRKVIRRLKISRKSYPFESFYGGGQWWCLSNNCLQYVLDFTKSNKKKVSFFKYVHIPDELFFQTILLNSPFKDQIINNHLRYIDWSGVPAPKVLKEEDYQKLVNSQKLFARKFNTYINGKVLDMIDEFLEAEN